MNGGDITLSLGVDPSNFNKGMAKAENTADHLGNSFRRLGSIILATFSTKVISTFVKDGVSAANELNNSLQGLESMSVLYISNFN